MAMTMISRNTNTQTTTNIQRHMVFGELTVLRHAGHDTKGRDLYRCLCGCGVVIMATSDKLLSGKLTSCGHRTTNHGHKQAGYKTTSNAFLLGYRTERERGAYDDHPERELMILEQLMDKGGYTRREWSYLYARWHVLHSRVYKPTPRYVVMGIKCGKAAAEEKELINMLQCVRDIEEVLTDDEQRSSYSK